MRELIDIDTEIRSHEQTLKDLNQQVVAGEEIVSDPHAFSFRRHAQPLQNDVLERYQVQVQEKLDAHNKKTSRQKYAKSDAYATFRQSIYVGHGSLQSGIRVPDAHILGSTASKRGNAACRGILASRFVGALR
jgi:hypothetical protein